MLEMQSDPYPDVAGLAQQVVDYFLHLMANFDIIKQNSMRKQLQSMSNISLPSSFGDNTTQIKQPDLNTEFVAWCNKYFLKPLLSTQSQDSKSEP